MTAGSHRLIGASVEKALDTTLWQLVLGEIGLHDCTPAIVGLYSIGHAHGVESVLEQLRQAENDRDRYFELWANPGKDLTDIRLRRMRQASEEYWRQFLETEGAAE